MLKMTKFKAKIDRGVSNGVKREGKEKTYLQGGREGKGGGGREGGGNGFRTDF
jgi:hypothetical protein